LGHALVETKTGDRVLGLTVPWEGLEYWSGTPETRRGRKKAAPKEKEPEP
jgi:hypothetical protein